MDTKSHDLLREHVQVEEVGSGHAEHALDLPFFRDNEKLWALPIEAEVMAIDELRWMLTIPFWEDNKNNIVITVDQVLKNPKKYPGHTKLIDDCDTSYPVHITKNKLGEWIILDGLHRMANLVREGKEEIMVKKVTIEQLWQCKKEK